jgi:hypothetical protein
MKVTAWKNIDVEVEVDVDIADVLLSCAEIQREATGKYWKRWGGTLDTLTRILAATKDELIAAIPIEARREVHRRLTVEAARWAVDSNQESLP